MSPRMAVIVRGHCIVPAYEDEAVVHVDIALVVLGQADVIFDLLVGRDAADEQDVRKAVLQHRLERRDPRGPSEPVGVHEERRHGRAGEAEGLEFPAVVVRDAEGEVDPIRERRQFGAPRARQSRNARRQTARRTGRRDVVIHQHARPGSGRERRGHGRGHGEMEDRRRRPSRAAGSCPGQDVAREVLVDREREDLGVVAPATETDPGAIRV